MAYVTSATWNTIVTQQEHWFTPKVVISENEYTASQIMSLSTELRVFPGETPSVGACLSSELNLVMLRPSEPIPRMAEIKVYVQASGLIKAGTSSTVIGTNLRLIDFVSASGTDLAFENGSNATVVGTDLALTNQSGVQTSEWIPQGVYYIDTREYSKNYDGLDIVTIHAYDAMLMTEQEYPDTAHAWPMYDDEVVDEIAQALGVGVDDRTWDAMGRLYRISAPLGYSMREVLGNIAAMYAGNFVMNYDGELLLVTVNGVPAETNYLVEENGYAITFGGDRILV